MAIFIHTASSCVRRTDQKSYVERQRNAILSYRGLDSEFDLDLKQHDEAGKPDESRGAGGGGRALAHAPSSTKSKSGAPDSDLFIVIGDSEIRTFHRTYNLTSINVDHELQRELVDLTVFKGEPREMRALRLKGEMALRMLDADGKGHRAGAGTRAGGEGLDVELTREQELRMAVHGWVEEEAPPLGPGLPVYSSSSSPPGGGAAAAAAAAARAKVASPLPYQHRSRDRSRLPPPPPVTPATQMLQSAHSQSEARAVSPPRVWPAFAPRYGGGEVKYVPKEERKRPPSVPVFWNKTVIPLPDSQDQQPRPAALKSPSPQRFDVPAPAGASAAAVDVSSASQHQQQQHQQEVLGARPIVEFSRNKWKAWFRHGRRRHPVLEAAATEERLLRAERERRERAALKKTQKVRHHRVTCIHHRNAAQFIEEARRRVRDKRFPHDALEESEARLALSRNGGSAQLFGVPASALLDASRLGGTSSVLDQSRQRQQQQQRQNQQQSSKLNQSTSSMASSVLTHAPAPQQQQQHQPSSQRVLFPASSGAGDSSFSTPSTPASSQNPSRQSSAHAAGASTRLPAAAESPASSPIPRVALGRMREPRSSNNNGGGAKPEAGATPPRRPSPGRAAAVHSKVGPAHATPQEERMLRNYLRTFYDAAAAARDRDADDDALSRNSGSTARRSSSRGSFFLTNVALAHEQQQQQSGDEGSDNGSSPDRNADDDDEDGDNGIAHWTRLCSCTPRSTDDERSDSGDDELWADYDANNAKSNAVGGGGNDGEDGGEGQQQGGGGGANGVAGDDLAAFDEHLQRKRRLEQEEQQEQLWRRRQEWLKRRRAAKGGVREPANYRSLVPFEQSALRAQRSLDKHRRLRGEMESLRAHQVSATVALRNASRNVLIGRARSQLEEAIVQPALEAAERWSRARSVVPVKTLRREIEAQAAAQRDAMRGTHSRCVQEQLRSITPIPSVWTTHLGGKPPTPGALQKQQQQQQQQQSTAGSDEELAPVMSKQEKLRRKIEDVLAGRRPVPGGSRASTPMSVASRTAGFF